MLLSNMIMIVILIASHTLSSREGDRSARLQGLDLPRGECFRDITLSTQNGIFPRQLRK